MGVEKNNLQMDYIHSKKNLSIPETNVVPGQDVGNFRSHVFDSVPMLSRSEIALFLHVFITV
jgi:hypothetical protein